MITDTELRRLRQLCVLRPDETLADLVMLLIRSYTDALRREEALLSERREAIAILSAQPETRAGQTLVEAIQAMIAERERQRAAVQAAFEDVDREQQAGAQFDNILLAVSSRIALAWIEARDVSS